MDWQALFLSLKLALLTSCLLLLLGIPLALWLAFSRFRGRFLLEAVVALPLVLPPTVLGFYVLWMLGPNSPLGQFITTWLGHPLPFSFEGLLVASVLYSLPFAVQPFTAAFSAIDRRLLEAAWTLGASRWKVLFQVLLPLSLPGLLTGFILSFAHTLGEFGVVLMVGGNLPGQTRTISIAIYDDVQALNYEQAGQTSLVLLGLSFVMLVMVQRLSRRRLV